MRKMLWILVAAVTFSGVASAEDAKRIAVVNVSRVFDAYVKVKDIEDKMKKLFEPEKKKLDEEDRDLKRREDALRVDGRDPKTNLEFFKEIQTFELAKMQLESKSRDLIKRVEERRKNEMKAVLNDIKTAIRGVGVAEKFDLVLRAPEFEEVFDPAKAGAAADNEAHTAAELVRKFRENPVLYFSQGVDVTDKVLARLNDDYKAAAVK
ncbi:MAG: OmpH family outer membrane protein [Planctomycetota bacterium]